MLGEDEVSRQQVTVRDMNTKEQAQVDFDAVVDYVQGALA
jgi:histidyl-tRNA synthetase